jgi:hypothetical protein
MLLLLAARLSLAGMGLDELQWPRVSWVLIPAGFPWRDEMERAS